MHEELFEIIGSKDENILNTLPAELAKLPKDYISKIILDIAPRYNLIEYAINRNNLFAVETLINCGFDINQKNLEGNTPLLHAIKQDRVEMADYLIKKDADINIPDIYGKTPLQAAKDEENRVIEKLIVRKNLERELNRVLLKDLNPINAIDFADNLENLQNKLKAFIDNVKSGDNVKDDKNDIFIVSVIGFLYFLNKYENSCSPLEFISGKLYHNDNLWWTCINGKRKLSYGANFLKRYKLCLKNKKVRFIVCLLGLEYDQGCDKKWEVAHSNVLIQDKVKGTLERFEPNGKKFGNAYEGILLDRAIKKFFIKNNDFGIKQYMSPFGYCPTLGFQNLEDPVEASDTTKYWKGYCAAWTQFYINLRLQFPDVNPIELIDTTIDALKKSPKSFTRFIQDFADFVIKASLAMNKEFKEKNKDELIDSEHPVINGLIRMVLKKKGLLDDEE